MFDGAGKPRLTTMDTGDPNQPGPDYKPLLDRCAAQTVDILPPDPPGQMPGSPASGIADGLPEHVAHLRPECLPKRKGVELQEHGIEPPQNGRTDSHTPDSAILV